jgi:UDP-N-acetylmuramate--alanine ligase
MYETNALTGGSRVSRTSVPGLLDESTDRLRGLGDAHWGMPYAGKRIHLIGIGGCGMRGLAGVLIQCGARVTGSDRAKSHEISDLISRGAAIEIGQAARNIPDPCDIVVHSAAVKEDNPELVEAHRRGLRIRRYAEMLGDVMALRTGIAIAGTHGKSTTTAMVAYILDRARLDPTYVVGAGVRQLGGSCGVGGGPHFVVEACEFERSFLNYRPHLAAILNIEEDHLDFYKDLGAIIEAFRAFARNVPHDGRLLANSADRAVAAAIAGAHCTVETFGFDRESTWSAANVSATRGCYRFTVLRTGREFARIDLENLPGRHQIGNALVATALATHAGVVPDTIVRSLGEFSGAERRLTHCGRVRGVDIYDDYGHHPTEIQVTLRAVRERHPGRRLWVIFQPHQHSRTRFLMSDFARSFGAADHVIVPDIYFVRDSGNMRDEVSSSDLVERVRANGGDAIYLPDFESIIAHVRENVRDNDLIVTMGAGDIWKVSDELVRRLD